MCSRRDNRKGCSKKTIPGYLRCPEKMGRGPVLPGAIGDSFLMVKVIRSIPFRGLRSWNGLAVFLMSMQETQTGEERLL